MDTTQVALEAQAPIVKRIREIAEGARERFEKAQVALSEHALSGYNLRASEIDTYVDAYAELGVFEQALGFLDGHGLVDVERVRRWNFARVTMYIQRGSGIEAQQRIAEDAAQRWLMRVLNGER